MAFNGSYEISITSDPTSFIITDNSTGSDPNLTSRNIYLYLADGSLLGGSVISWPVGEGSIKTIALLNRDYCINIRVDWISSSPLPSPSTYTLSNVYPFKGNEVEFVYGLLQQLAANPGLLNDTNWVDSLSSLQMFIDGSQTAGGFGDISNSQFQLDLGYSLIVNENNYF